MYKIIVFSHGTLAESLLNTSKLILGEQEDVEAYCVEPGCNLEELRDKVRMSVQRSNQLKQQVLVLTDLMYGTPFNIMIQMEEEGSFRHITGMNLPLLLEAINRRGIGGGVDGLEEIGRQGIIDSRTLLQMV